MAAVDAEKMPVPKLERWGSKEEVAISSEEPVGMVPIVNLLGLATGEVLWVCVAGESAARNQSCAICGCCDADSRIHTSGERWANLFQGRAAGALLKSGSAFGWMIISFSVPFLLILNGLGRQMLRWAYPSAR